MVGILDGFVAVFLPAPVTIIRNPPLAVVQFLENHSRLCLLSAKFSEDSPANITSVFLVCV